MNTKNNKNLFGSILWFCALCFFIFKFGSFCVIPNVFSREWLSCFCKNETQLGTLMSAFALFNAIFMIPAGILFDRLNSKKLLSALFFIASLATFFLGRADSFGEAYFAQAVVGAATSFAFVGLLKISTEVYPASKAGFMSSLGIAIGSFSPVLLTPYFVRLGGLLSWRDSVKIFAAVGLAFATLVSMLPKSKSDCALDSHIENEPILKSLKEIILDRNLLYLGLYSVAMFAPPSALANAWGTHFVKTVYNVDVERAAFASSLISFGTTLGVPLLTLMAQKLKDFKKVMILSSSIFVLLFAAVVWAELNFFVLEVFLFFLGFFMGAQFLPFVLLLGIVPSQRAATASSFINAIDLFGISIAVSSVGFFLDFLANSYGSSIEASSPLALQIALTPLIIFSSLAILISAFLIKFKGENKKARA
ncbi:MAG: MFS transporter [Holosporaceae bacterium]|jgi:predicted MFS family arabinose efflux permease|nr:MFS transporter [Holosporaceae bacterium]